MNIKTLELTNPSDFMQEMYRFSLDRSKLKFDRLSLDIKFYQEALKKYLLSNYSILERGNIIKVTVIKKDNSFLGEDVIFPFKISGAVNLNKKKRGIEPLYRVKLKFLVKEEKPKKK